MVDLATDVTIRLFGVKGHWYSKGHFWPHLILRNFKYLQNIYTEPIYVIYAPCKIFSWYSRVEILKITQNVPKNTEK